MSQGFYRRVVVVKPLNHRQGKGLTEAERSSVKRLAKEIGCKLLIGRTVIVCAPTICGQEMAHMFSNELITGMPIVCDALKPRRPHHHEPLNQQGLVSMIDNLTADNANVILLTHVHELEDLEAFAHWCSEHNLRLAPDELMSLRRGTMVIDCHL